MLINLKRILKFGWHSFSRNKGLGFQVIFIMATAVFFILVFFLGRGVGRTLFDEMGRKVDISVYFKSETTEQEILEVKNRLSSLSDKIKTIEYVSKERALTIFKAEHQSDDLYLNALEEAKENPLLPSLNIYSDDPNYYAKISGFLKEPPTNDIVEKISYEQPKNRQAIETLAAIAKGIKIVGIIIVGLLGLLVIIITSNIIKLTFIVLKDEISTMKLVGASDWFVRGPFMIQTFFYGLFAVIIVDTFSGILLYFISGKAIHWFSEFNIFSYFFSNLAVIFGFQLGFVALLGAVSTLLVMRKHLKA
ncbi:MAG: permease-like cell division protein FtsX [Candidatus Pacebacteria bacterium]|nr:permease-like cell division protein FtsX [Candidatus Paceibacterota bacterium]